MALAWNGWIVAAAVEKRLSGPLLFSVKGAYLKMCLFLIGHNIAIV